MASRLDPYSLRLFGAAATEGSIARAAAKEHIAASALSRRIADLEHTLGAALLLRSPRGIALTEAGQIVFRRGVRIDEDLQTLVREVQASSGQVSGTLRICANISSIVGFLPERLQRFCTEYPLVEIALQERMSDEVIRACLEDCADIGVGVARRVPNSIESWHFAADPLMVVLPLGHTLAGRRSLRFKDVLAYPLVTTKTGGAVDQVLRERAAAARIPFRSSVAVSSFDASCRMVEAGLGIAVLPNSAASAYAGSHRFLRVALEEPWSNHELRLYAPRKSPRPRSLAALMAALRG
jgi:DNA-binding transcriptional LysR family regulator